MKRLSVDILKRYLDKDNFATQEWELRGLMPSSAEVAKELNALLLQVVQNLINTHERGLLNRGSVLEILNKISFEKFDTEERELFMDKLILIFSEIKLKRLIKEWLVVDPKEPIVRSYYQIRITKQKCLRCRNNLINWILKTDDLEYPFWEIGECNECGKLNLIKIDKVSSFEPKTFDIIKSLKKNEYTEEAALKEIDRLEKR